MGPNHLKILNLNDCLQMNQMGVQGGHGSWSDSKGSVITVNNTPSFPLFMLSSASAVVVPYPLSWWKVIHLLCQLQKEASVFETFI